MVKWWVIQSALNVLVIQSGLKIATELIHHTINYVIASEMYDYEKDALETVNLIGDKKICKTGSQFKATISKSNGEWI